MNTDTNTNMNTLTIISPLRPQYTACGTYLVGRVEVANEEFRIEADLDKTWFSVIDENSRQESCVIEDGCIVFRSGEWVTDKWTDADWDAMNLHVAQAKA